jgi:hypothetical protein
MKFRLTVFILAFGLLAVGCSDDDAELSTDSTIITGGTNAPAPTTTTTLEGEDNSGASPTTTLVGETVTEFEVVARFPNDNGEERYYVIPNGAYTDVDLENFVIDLIEADDELYGAEIFDDAAAADAYQVDPADRTEEQTELIERHHFVTLVGRDRIEFVGPFSEFPGGAIGS